ncbi:MAG: hypothetical protein ABSG56_08005 [Bryobacteraceae bacterium]|jgi:hypothetical protein
MSLNTKLGADPLGFARKYSIKAGDVAGGQSAEDRRTVNGYIYSKMLTGTKISYLNCWQADLGKDVTMRAPRGTFTDEEINRSIAEGADTVCITAQAAADPAMVPAWFLPWDTRGGVVALRIPPMAGYGGAYPPFFLTAAINGCSVFVTGTSKNPRVFHGGKGTGVDGDAVQIWRDMVVSISGKTEAQLAQANKTMYVKDGTLDSQGLATTRTAKTFEDALNRHYAPWRNNNMNKNLIQLTEIRPWGAFFGICSAGGDWTFYLQENATISYQMYEKPAPENNNFFDSIAKKFKKQKPIPGRSFSVSRPMTVRQIFPGGGGVAAMTSSFKWNSLRG